MQQHQPKTGDRIEVKTAEGAMQGTLLQSPEFEEGTLLLKLESGYNIGISRKNISEIRLLEKALEKEQHPQPIHEHRRDASLKTISILHTGGTIASKIDYRTGGVTPKYDASEMLEMFPELARIANIKSRQIIQTMSEMIRFPHYNLIAREIEREINEGTDGIILTHGTDTLHYTAAALSFILEDLPVPVIIVGAQRSSDRGSSDAALNLIAAAQFIAGTDFPEVAICMHETISDTSCLILPATKTRKMHTSRRDAFRPINTTAIARVEPEENKITFLKKPAKREKSQLKLKLIDEKIRVAIIKTHTNMHPEQFLAYKGYDGLVIEGTGLGHIPNQQIDEETAENKGIQEAIKALTGSGTLIVLASQVIYGRIQMNVYAPQRELRHAGVLGHLSDMTPETAFIKLAWLLSNHKKEKIPELITKSLRGEITERTEKETFLT